MQWLDGIDGEPGAALADDHFTEDAILLERLKGEHFLKFSDVFKIHQPPPRLLGVGFGIVVFASNIELSGIGVGAADDAGDAGDAGRLGVGMIKKREVAGLHFFPHEIASLVVSDATPWFPFDLGEIIDAEDIGFRLDEPVAHAIFFQAMAWIKFVLAAGSVRCSGPSSSP